jgi:predicted nucleic acid-binding protein
MKEIKHIFIDSDAFIALAKEDDANHEKALGIMERLEKEEVVLFSSNYVFAETVTVLSYKVNHQAALSFIKEIKSLESPFLIKWIDLAVENLAIEIFTEQDSKNISFIDCTNMALMKSENLDAIFSFDAVYQRNGFCMISSCQDLIG